MLDVLAGFGCVAHLLGFAFTLGICYDAIEDTDSKGVWWPVWAWATAVVWPLFWIYVIVKNWFDSRVK